MIEKLLKKKYLRYLLIFFSGLLITSPLLIPSFNVDSYCTMQVGYLETSKIFLKAGRLFTSIIYYINDLINMPFEIFSILSVVLSNIFLSLSIYKLYDYLIKYTKDKVVNKVILLAGLFLFFYNPLVIELFLFDETFVICAGILFLVLSSIYLLKNQTYISLLFLILATTCYQGIVCFFIPLSFMLEILNLKGNLKKEFKLLLKKIIRIVVIYGISLFYSYILVNVINKVILIEATQKIGKIDILFNIKKTIQLFIKSVISLYSYANRNVFYMVIFVSLLCIFIVKFKNSKNKVKLVYFIFNIILCAVVPFIPNLAMNSSANYTAARMASSLGAIVGLIIIYSVLYFDMFSVKKIRNVLSIIFIIYFVYNCSLFFNTSIASYKRYKKDMESIDNIYKIINKYEEKNNIKVKEIYYAKDSHVNYFYYENIILNSHNYRLYAIDWAMSCAINIKEDRFIYKEMSEKTKKQYFNQKEYDTFAEEQLIFDKDKVYLLIY